MCVPFALFAQNAEIYRLTTSDWQVGLARTAVKDPYLSPLQYNGSGVTANFNDKRFFLKNSEKFISTSNLSVFYANLLNPSKTAAMQYFGINVNYGVHYKFLIKKNFSVLTGTSADIDFGFKYLARNSNNPFNMDFAANLNLSVAAMLKIPLWRRVFQLELNARTPILGAMFAPQKGASYYEMGTFDGGMSNVFHFSNLANKNGLRTNLVFDIPLNRITISLSGNAEFLKFKANNAVYSRSLCGFGIGFKYSFITFAGRKKLPPENFRSTE
jgi:hypothetical protein